MCNFDPKSVPKGWQWVCLKSSGVVPMDSQNCSKFCSPNGKVFTSLEEVHAHNRLAEMLKLEKENRRLLKGMKQENSVNKVSVNNSTMLACNYCEQSFFSPSMLKKHEREIHMMLNGIPRGVKCDHCGKAFPTVPHLQNHIREFHMTNNQCKFCGKQFESIYRLDEHVKTLHRKSGGLRQLEPLNLPQTELPKNRYQYNPREVENQMVETVYRKNPYQDRKQIQNPSVSSSNIFSTGISVPGLPINNTKPNLSNIRLERNMPQSSEAVSKISSLKDVSLSRKPKHQPLGPQIMEQYLASGSNNFTQMPMKQSDFQIRHEPRPKVSSEEMAARFESSEQMVARFKQEYQQLNDKQLYNQPTQPKQEYNQPKQLYNQPTQPKQIYNQPLPIFPSQPPQHINQSLPVFSAPKRPAPITREEMLQALNNKSDIFHARRRDVSLPTMRKTGLRKVSRKVGMKANPLRRKPFNPTIAGKNQISVSLACKYLGLKDYPVPITEHNRKLFENRSLFEEYYLPLVASVNKGSNPLGIQTLVKAKWYEVLKTKAGESKSIYFNKPRRNKVKVNVAVSY